LYARTGFARYTEGGPTLSASSHKRPEENFVIHDVTSYVKTVRSGARDADGNLPPEVWAAESVSPTLNAHDNSGESRSTVLIVDGTRVNDVRVYDDGIMPTLKARMGTGGGQVPLVTSVIGFNTKQDPISSVDISPSLPRNNGELGVAIPSDNNLVLRRLTPIECERLMGFPDDHTRWGSDGKEISNTTRYKMLGNAVAVPVVSWIANILNEHIS
jgi:site-specific DNA-cytosine methylase